MKSNSYIIMIIISILLLKFILYQCKSENFTDTDTNIDITYINKLSNIGKQIIKPNGIVNDKLKVDKIIVNNLQIKDYDIVQRINKLKQRKSSIESIINKYNNLITEIYKIPAKSVVGIQVISSRTRFGTPSPNIIPEL